MTNHPDHFMPFISKSTDEILTSTKDSCDLLSIQYGRFASYVERETPIPSTGFSIFTNYCFIPEGYVLIGVSLDTMFNSLILGRDKDFLPVAMNKYPTFAKSFQVFQNMRRSPPNIGQVWLGIDKDPHDGAEITTICAMKPVDRSKVRDAEFLLRRIKEEDLREIASRVIEVGFDVLIETKTPINPIKDTLDYKWIEFKQDIRDPKKVFDTALKVLIKKYGWDIFDNESGKFLIEHKDLLIGEIGQNAFNMILIVQQNREKIMNNVELVEYINSLRSKNEKESEKNIIELFEFLKLMSSLGKK